MKTRKEKKEKNGRSLEEEKRLKNVKIWGRKIVSSYKRIKFK
jgi:hypothetical protein